MRRKIHPHLLIEEARNPVFADCNFSRPDQINWPKSWIEIDALRKEIMRVIPQTHSRLVDLSLAAHFLMTSSEQINLHAREEFINILGADLLPEEIFNENNNWRLVPVAVVPDGQEAKIYYFMVGSQTNPAGASWPGWLTDHLNITSQLAIHDAFHAVQQLSGAFCNLFTFPLKSPDTIWNINGRSLGLPLALAALSAATGEALSSKLLATGDVRCDSTKFLIEAVADISAKAKAARLEDCRLLLVPKAASTLAEQPHGLTIRPVSDLKEAWLWARLYAPGKEKDLEQLHYMQNDASLLVDNCLNIDRELLEWLIRSEDGKALCNAIIMDSNCVKNLVNKLEDCLAPADRDIERADILATLIPDEISLTALESRYRLQALKWAVLNLKRANHQGKTKESHYWGQRREKLRGRAINTETEKEYSEFINNLLVSHHNTYTFRPDPPAEFMDALREEERYKRGCSYILGCMYGTLAQNYGFCGPEYLKPVIDNIHQAQSEFADGSNPDYRDDWIREFSYLVYANLDAKKWTDARDSLWKYLLISSWSDMKEWSELNPYERFALTRYLADTTCHLCDASDKEISSRLLCSLDNFHFETYHPYQLITFNLGRIAMNCNNFEIAGAFFNKSVMLCEQNEETIRVMALLPLAGLYHAGLFARQYESSAAAVLELIRSSQHLNQPHFELLMKGTVHYALDLIWNNPARYFPFSYR